MLGDRIKQRMAEIGIETQVQLAEKSGLSTQLISALIGGRRGQRMEAQTALKLGKALRVKPLFFLLDSTAVEKTNVCHAVVDRGAGGSRAPLE